MNKHFPPKFAEKSFHCPFCNVYAQQSWHNMFYYTYSHVPLNFLRASVCSHCDRMSFWLNDVILFPEANSTPTPHPDLPDELMEDYLEAASIVNKSPRGAAALLRLILQKLMFYLGETGKDINKDIGSLVQKGLPPQVQQALDIVRVVGNEAVHPGQINIKDDFNLAIQLFELINFIVEDRITRPKTIESLFNTLPEGKRKGIEDRDKISTD